MEAADRAAQNRVEKPLQPTFLALGLALALASTPIGAGGAELTESIERPGFSFRYPAPWQELDAMASERSALIYRATPAGDASCAARQLAKDRSHDPETTTNMSGLMRIPEAIAMVLVPQGDLLTSAEAGKVNGLDVVWATSEGDGRKSRHGFFMIPGNIHILSCTVAADDYDEVEAEFAAIISSFSYSPRSQPL